MSQVSIKQSARFGEDSSPVEKPVFDPMFDSDFAFLQDPYPMLKAIGKDSPVVWSPKGNHYLITGMAEANQVLKSNDYGKRLEKWKHPNLFLRLFLNLMGGRIGLTNILRQDPPEHTRVRGLMSAAFVPQVVQQMEPKIQKIADELIDDIADSKGDTAELISQYAFLLPIAVIADLLGVPYEDRDKFKHWSTQVTGSLQGSACPIKVTKSFAASFELRKYLKKAIAAKLKNPGEDLLSRLAMVQSAEDGRLSEEELISNSILLLIAGHETTVNLIGNGLYHLMREPEQRRLLEENPELIKDCVEEVLRYDSPVQIVRRIAKHDMELAGQKIKTDDALTVLIGACNRDNDLAHDRFDITRQNRKHVSFGAGIHYCLGSELARVEARIAISTILRRLPSMSLASPVMPYKAPFALRGLARLDVTVR